MAVAGPDGGGGCWGGGRGRGEGAAESQEKGTWLWQSSQKSFQGHLVAAGRSFSLESRGKYDRGGGELWGLIPTPRLEPKCWWH